MDDEPKPSQYTVMVKGTTSTSSIVPREGYTLTGSIPLGQWKSLIFKRTEDVEAMNRLLNGDDDTK